MASPSLALPGVLFVGEDERARLVAHLGPAAGWMIPKGVLGWSTEVSVVSRDALTEAVRRDAKIVMPAEQIPSGKLPLTHQAAQKSPLVAISANVSQKLVEAGLRVHTVGADRVTSSFYYLAEGGGEEPIRIEGDLVAAVGAMLGERADNAAIERVLDGLVDRLVRSLSKDRVTELSLELAHALPRAAADGSGMNDVDLESFEKELASLVGASEKYTPFLQEITTKLGESNNERRVDIPLYGDARKVSQGPFELEVGVKKVALVTHERWLATGPFTEPSAKPAPGTAAKAAPAAKTPEPKPAAAKTPEPKPAAAKTPEPKPAAAKTPEPKAAVPTPTAAKTPEPAKADAPKEKAPEPTKADAPKAEPAKAEPAKAEPAKAEPGKGKLGATMAMPAAPPRPSPDDEKSAAAEPAKTKTKTIPIQAPAAQASTKTTPKPAPALVTKARAASSPDHQVTPRDSRLAATQKVAKKDKSFPWLWLLVIAAAAFAGYRFIWMRRQ